MSSLPPPAVRATERIGLIWLRQEHRRVLIIFPSPPATATEALLKRYGFRYSPGLDAWTRIATDATWYAAQEIARIAVGLAP